MKAPQKNKLVERQHTCNKIVKNGITEVQPERPLFAGQKLLVFQVPEKFSGNQVHTCKGKSFG